MDLIIAVEQMDSFTGSSFTVSWEIDAILVDHINEYEFVPVAVSTLFNAIPRPALNNIQL
jgi:hypothetical protein